MVEEQTLIRESLGLEAASEGDPKGVSRFMSWLGGELTMLAYTTPDMPKPVSERLSQLAKDTDRLMQFCDGFVEGRASAVN
jgi:hypothetical protein